jgi:hypothetical protein
MLWNPIRLKLTYITLNQNIFAPVRPTVKSNTVSIRVGFVDLLGDEISPSEEQINLHRHFSIWSEARNMELSNEDKYRKLWWSVC